MRTGERRLRHSPSSVPHSLFLSHSLSLSLSPFSLSLFLPFVDDCSYLSHHSACSIPTRTRRHLFFSNASATSPLKKNTCVSSSSSSYGHYLCITGARSRMRPRLDIGVVIGEHTAVATRRNASRTHRGRPTSPRRDASFAVRRASCPSSFSFSRDFYDSPWHNNAP